MSDTLDSIHQSFAEHRQHHRKGAYPVALRRRAALGLTRSDLLQLAARLGLTAAQVGRWSALAEGQQAEAQEFFEVAGVVAAPVVGPGLRIEAQLCNGVVLRMQGQVDTDALRMLVAALQTVAVAP